MVFKDLLKLKSFIDLKELLKDGLELEAVDNYKELWDEYINQIKGYSYSHRYIYQDIKNSNSNFLKGFQPIWL